ncbi:MAG: amino acid permease, partial [FCB group bacterium]|nr:amino acid permease [FCB group bacterium]
FSISSALNATLYGGANVSYSLAKDGELPKIFERKTWFKSTEGLYMTSILGMLFALLFNINGIASITSAIFISIYIFVIISHYKIVDQVGGNRKFLIFNLIVLLSVFLLLMYYQWETQRFSFYGTIITFSGAIIVESVYRHLTKRSFGKV